MNNLRITLYKGERKELIENIINNILIDESYWDRFLPQELIEKLNTEDVRERVLWFIADDIIDMVIDYLQ